MRIKQPLLCQAGWEYQQLVVMQVVLSTATDQKVHTKAPTPPVSDKHAAGVEANALDKSPQAEIETIM